MQRHDTTRLTPEQIAGLWRERINRRIWCSNQYARQLMDIGLPPPLTGNRALNPWAEFNISGQFLCETFALMAPGMPQSAERIALDYTTVGVVKGYRWMMSQGWTIVDRYRNTTRDEMPEDETITSFADRLADLGVKVILEGGGEASYSGGQPRYRIRRQRPRCVYPLTDPGEARKALRAELQEEVERIILRSSGDDARARAAYLAICLDMYPRFQREHPAEWAAAIEALAAHENVVQALFHHADVPGGPEVQRRALAAGLRRPAERRKLW